MGARVLEVVSLWLDGVEIDLLQAELWVIADYGVEWGITAVLGEPRSVLMGRYEVTLVTDDGVKRMGSMTLTASDGRTLRLRGTGNLLAIS
jgi:hypothetical protein